MMAVTITTPDNAASGPLEASTAPSYDTLASAIAQALAHPPTPPKPRPKSGKRKAGIWEGKSPEERTVYAKAIRANVKPENLKRTGRKVGTPNGWRYADVEVLMAKGREVGELLFPRTEDPPHSPPWYARVALVETFALLYIPTNAAFRLRVARLLLDFTKPKAVSERDLREQRAVEWLARLAAAEGDDE